MEGPSPFRNQFNEVTKSKNYSSVGIVTNCFTDNYMVIMKYLSGKGSKKPVLLNCTLSTKESGKTILEDYTTSNLSLKSGKVSTVVVDNMMLS